MLTGSVPFFDPNPIVAAMQHVRNPVPAHLLLESGVPPDLARIVRTCLAKKPEERFPSADALDAALGAAQRPGGAASVELGPVVAVAPRRTPVVLVVDDDPGLLEFVRMCLSAEGFEILTAPDGERALEILQGTEADVVLMDVRMPTIDGFDVTRVLKSQPRHARLPVFLMSAHADRRSVAFALQIGAVDLLAKPLSPTELPKQLRAALRYPARPPTASGSTSALPRA
jgi:CheY-like chemotaxis protein